MNLDEPFKKNSNIETQLPEIKNWPLKLKCNATFRQQSKCCSSFESDTSLNLSIPFEYSCSVVRPIPLPSVRTPLLPFCLQRFRCAKTYHFCRFYRPELNCNKFWVLIFFREVEISVFVWTGKSSFNLDWKQKWWIKWKEKWIIRKRNLRISGHRTNGCNAHQICDLFLGAKKSLHF